MQRHKKTYVTLVAILLLFLGITSICLWQFVPEMKSGSPVEPFVAGEEAVSQFDFWHYQSPEVNIYDLSVDRSLNNIFFSSNAGKVSLLDRNGRLRWEKNLDANPLQAKISSCGMYVSVGTEGGRLLFMSTDQQQHWEVETGLPINRLVLSAGARWIVTGSGSAESGYRLSLYDRQGTLCWQKDTGELADVFIAGEAERERNMAGAEEDRECIFYTEKLGESGKTSCLDLSGEIIWSREETVLCNLSPHGDLLAAIEGEILIVLDRLGRELWRAVLPFRISTVLFNPRNAHILVSGDGEGAKDNLYYYSAAGDFQWCRKIDDGSLVAFTADGRHIVAASWRQYKEDYSQMILLDERGVETDRWEVAVQVEHLAVADDRQYIVLGGLDGNIYILDLQAGLEQAQEKDSLLFYQPVIMDKQHDANKITLYFYNDRTDILVPVTRTVDKTENPLRAAVEELIRGPARDSGLFRTIPKDARIDLRFEEESGRLYLDLAPELAQVAGAAQSIGLVDSLLLTVSAFRQVKEVYLTVDNEAVAVIGDGLSLEQPLQPYRRQQPVFVPVLTGKRYYLVPTEAEQLGLAKRDLQGLLAAVLKRCRSEALYNVDLAVQNVVVTPEAVGINLTGDTAALFPHGDAGQEQMKAALLLDALFLTALENSTAQKIYLLVNGRNWLPPENYPYLTREFTGPYYLNPEQ